MHPSSGLPETVHSGRYLLGAVLGEGGMALVCRATDTELGVERAVKLVFHNSGGTSRESVRRRLRAEARAMARLRHPNVLGIHDVGHEEGFDWVVMDLADGGSLRDLQAAGPMSPADGVRVMVQVLSALATAHAAGIVHRDVKPHNILLDDEGRPLLADFGIALLTGDDRRTRTGVAMGSLAYMPPEQRLDAARVGPAADIYAAGTTLYDLVTGDNPVDLFLAREGDPRWDAVPNVLQPILRRACAATPAGRYPDAGAMARDLVDVLRRTDNDGIAQLHRPRNLYPAPSDVFTDRSVATAPPVEVGGNVDVAMTFLDDPSGDLGPNPTLSPGDPEPVLRTRTLVAPDGPTSMPPESESAAVVSGSSSRERVWVALAVGALAVLLVVVWWARPVASDAVDPVVPVDVRPGGVDAVGPVPTPPTPGPGGEVESKPSPQVEPGPAPAPTVVAAVVPKLSAVPVAPTTAPTETSDGSSDEEPTPTFGAFRGSMGGVIITLNLSGPPSALTGSTSSIADGEEIYSARVSATLDAQGKMTVVEQTPDRTTWNLRLEGDKLVGEAQAPEGIRPVNLRRVE